MKQSAKQKKSLEQAAHKYAEDIQHAEAYLAKRGLSLDDARTFHLGVCVTPAPGHEQMVGRLSIPYLTDNGVADIRFRALGPEEPKYMGLTGNQTHLYNVKAILRANDTLAICEGEIDAITLHHKVGIPAIGVPGANNWKPHYLRLLQDFETVIIFADGDQPGQEFAKKIAREVPGVIIINMPEGEDVNSIYLQHGADWFKGRIEQ